jgi:hypothetical protein
MMGDFYSDAARRRLDQLNAEAQQALADLANAKANDDYDTAAVLVERLGDIQSAQAKVNQIHAEYLRSQNPPPPPQPSKEERASRPWDRMTWDDALDMARTSKYGRNLRHDDPHVQAAYREVQARRARGE